MPSKEEYTLLLSNGLGIKIIGMDENWDFFNWLKYLKTGARKWQVSLSLNAEEFRRAIISIYPRLGNILGFSMWNIKKDKSFEKLPVKVRTVESNIYVYEKWVKLFFVKKDDVERQISKILKWLFAFEIWSCGSNTPSEMDKDHMSDRLDYSQLDKYYVFSLRKKT